MKLTPVRRTHFSQLFHSRKLLPLITLCGFGVTALTLIGCKRGRLAGEAMPPPHTDSNSVIIEYDMPLPGEAMPETVEEETDETLTK